MSFNSLSPSKQANGCSVVPFVMVNNQFGESEMQYEMTQHAVTRAAQRGIKFETIELIISLADRRTRTPGGTVALSISDKAQSCWIHGGLPAADISRVRGVVLIADTKSNEIITVEHTYGRRRRFCR